MKSCSRPTEGSNPKLALMRHFSVLGEFSVAHPSSSSDIRQLVAVCPLAASFLFGGLMCQRQAVRI
ncbi:hypothetical protein SBA7_380022 [Candidatus Sulfotelmatobacter sp. SbA7]|nr:hypothetical protein SBA7_380022 [Candidatus Sulfotelmatobacter sp. SbA7]